MTFCAGHTCDLYSDLLMSVLILQQHIYRGSIQFSSKKQRYNEIFIIEIETQIVTVNFDIQLLTLERC
jgi:hypothetical protein